MAKLSFPAFLIGLSPAGRIFAKFPKFTHGPNLRKAQIGVPEVKKMFTFSKLLFARKPQSELFADLARV